MTIFTPRGTHRQSSLLGIYIAFTKLRCDWHCMRHCSPTQALELQVWPQTWRIGALGDRSGNRFTRALQPLLVQRCGLSPTHGAPHSQPQPGTSGSTENIQPSASAFMLRVPVTQIIPVARGRLGKWRDGQSHAKAQQFAPQAAHHTWSSPAPRALKDQPQSLG